MHSVFLWLDHRWLFSTLVEHNEILQAQESQSSQDFSPENSHGEYADRFIKLSTDTHTHTHTYTHSHKHTFVRYIPDLAEIHLTEFT